MSKRNEVFLQGGRVCKQVNTAASAETEAKILRKLYSRGVAVPQVLECRYNLLVLEYLPGEPLADIVEHGAYEPNILAVALCDWFAAFYEASRPGESRGDVNGRNFLYDGTTVYSVDFEEQCYASKAQDAGKLAAFISTYDTNHRHLQNTLMQAFVQEFAARFDCKPQNIEQYHKLEYSAMRLRRNKA